MAQEHIRSGEEVVKDFIASLDERADVDKNTLAAIRALHSAGRLTKNKLLGLLEEARGRR